MGLIVCIVFVGAFAVVALLMYAAGGGASHEAKRVYEALDSALASDDDSEDRNKDVNLRKSEMISSIPWLNRKLRELDLAPVLHSLLYQADLKWNAGTLVASSVLCFALPATPAETSQGACCVYEEHRLRAPSPAAIRSAKP